MTIKVMNSMDYEEAYALWSNTDGMGLRSLDDSKEGIDKFLKRNPTTNFVSRDGDRLMGVILCGHDGRRAYIYHTVVSEAYRGKGIGKDLLNAVLGALKEEGINKAALVVFNDNIKGNDFWASQGFINREDLTYRNRSLNDLNR